MMSTNVRSTFFCAQAVVPVMIQQHCGQILTISPERVFSGISRRVAPKFARAGLMEALDQELLGHTVKVSTIFFGGVNTHFAGAESK